MIEKPFADYVSAQQRVIEQIGRGDAAAAYETLTLEMLFIFERIYEQCKVLLSINEKLMFNTGSLTEHDNRTKNCLVIGRGVAGILSGLGLGLLLSQRIIHPIYNWVLRLRGLLKTRRCRKLTLPIFRNRSIWTNMCIN